MYELRKLFNNTPSQKATRHSLRRANQKRVRHSHIEILETNLSVSVKHVVEETNTLVQETSSLIIFRKAERLASGHILRATTRLANFVCNGNCKLCLFVSFHFTTRRDTVQAVTLMRLRERLWEKKTQKTSYAI